MAGLVQRNERVDKQNMVLRSAIDAIIRFALPSRCAGCGVIVGADHQLCVTCWASLNFLDEEGCTRCGILMEQSGMTCGPCLASPPLHDGVRAAVAYGDIARDLAVRLKHGRKVGLAKQMANAMASHLPSDGAVLVPVPLHRWRLWRRGFNQSLELARTLSHLGNLPIAAHALQRIRATPSLGGLGRVQRARALQGVFAIPKGQRHQIRGKHVLLIDDVYTSGATANGCARVLKRAGAARVTVLVWARVMREENAGLEGAGN